MLGRVLDRQTELQRQLRLSRSALSGQLGDAPHRKPPPQNLVQDRTADAEPETGLQPATLATMEQDGCTQRDTG